MRYIMIRKYLLLVMMAIYSHCSLANGVVVGATRVIYDASKKEASITIMNKNKDKHYLVQSWIEDEKGSKSTPFVITPPLFKMMPTKENVLRIVKTNGNLPSDRESVFWLNMKAIPPSPENDEGNNLQIAIKTRMKLFYRPQGLPGKAEDAAGKLIWKKNGADLVVQNNSAFSVTLTDVVYNNEKIASADLVPAKSSVRFPIKTKNGVNGTTITYKTITDFGGVSQEFNSRVVF
jgi:fimbrial chaperone protein